MTERTYMCAAGETFDLAALRIYGDEKFAQALLGANPELCRVLVFNGGEVLRVPEVEVQRDSNGNIISRPPWEV